MVEAEGVVNLGPAYGSVRVVGMTLEESKKAIEAKLGRMVREPEVSVQLARVSGRSRSAANTWSVPTARSTCGSTGWCTWPG